MRSPLLLGAGKRHRAWKFREGVDGVSVEDTALRESLPDTNNYTASVHYVGDSSGNVSRMLLRFDVSSIASAILSASLRTSTSGSFGPSVDLAIKRTTKAWVVSEATWNIFSTAGGAWDTPGGDYTETDASAIVTVTSTSSEWTSFDVTALALDAIANRSSLLDVILLPINPGAGEGRNCTASNGSVAFRPLLTVITR